MHIKLGSMLSLALFSFASLITVPSFALEEPTPTHMSSSSLTEEHPEGHGEEGHHHDHQIEEPLTPDKEASPVEELPELKEISSAVSRPSIPDNIAQATSFRTRSYTCVVGHVCAFDKLVAGKDYPSKLSSYYAYTIEEQEGKIWKSKGYYAIDNLKKGYTAFVASNQKAGKTKNYRITFTKSDRRTVDTKNIFKAKVSWVNPTGVSFQTWGHLNTSVAGQKNKMNASLRASSRKVYLERYDTSKKKWVRLGTRTTKKSSNLQHVSYTVKAPSKAGNVKYRILVNKTSKNASASHTFTVKNYNSKKFTAKNRAVYKVSKKYCPGTPVIGISPSKLKSMGHAPNIMGLANGGKNLIYINTSLKSSGYSWLARHECGHILQHQAYDNNRSRFPNDWGSNYARKMAPSYYKNTGRGTIETSADCIALYMGKETKKARYKKECSGKAGQATYNIMKGKPMDSPKITGSFYTKWNKGHQYTSLGYAVENRKTGLKNKGISQRFQKGYIYYNKKTGTHIVKGSILKKWNQAKGVKGSLGYPTGGQTKLRKAKKGYYGTYQNFQGGTIISSPKGTQIVKGKIGTKWKKMGWARSYMGVPTSYQKCGMKNKGCRQSFVGGTMYTSSKTSAQPVKKSSAIQRRWKALKSEKGKLGYPKSREYKTKGKMRQSFEKGYITYSKKQGTRVYYYKH